MLSDSTPSGVARRGRGSELSVIQQLQHARADAWAETTFRCRFEVLVVRRLVVYNSPLPDCCSLYDMDRGVLYLVRSDSGMA